jgi:hypothetical protein
MDRSRREVNGRRLIHRFASRLLPLPSHLLLSLLSLLHCMQLILILFSEKKTTFNNNNKKETRAAVCVLCRTSWIIKVPRGSHFIHDHTPSLLNHTFWEEMYLSHKGGTTYLWFRFPAPFLFLSLPLALSCDPHSLTPFLLCLLFNPLISTMYSPFVQRKWAVQDGVAGQTLSCQPLSYTRVVAFQHFTAQHFSHTFKQKQITNTSAACP